MRAELRKIGSKKRHRFEGTVIRFGIANNNFNPYNAVEETILLGDVFLLDENGQHEELVTDHLWFKRTLQFQRIDAQPGDVVQFDARVDDYYKRDRYADYYSKIRDYRLVRPTKIINVSRPDAKVDVPSIKEQQQVQRAKWEQERQERIEVEKVREASDAQVGYIKAITEHLKVEDPTTDGMLFTEARAWLDNQSFGSKKDRMYGTDAGVMLIIRKGHIELSTYADGGMTGLVFSEKDRTAHPKNADDMTINYTLKLAKTLVDAGIVSVPKRWREG